MSQASCWVSASLYISYSAASNKIGASVIYIFLGTLLALWLVSTFFFFYKIKRRYWSTFYSLQTGRQNTLSYFLDNADDVTRSLVFADNPDLWKDIREQVKAWTLSKWAEWEKEKPEWFTEAFKASIPDDFIPKVALEDLNKKGAGGKRRRSSAGFILDK